MGNPENRGTSGSKDQRFVNCFPEVLKNKATGESRVFLQKRPGLAAYSTPSTSAAARGIFYWPRTGKYYSVFGNKVYSNTTDINAASRLVGTTGSVGWAAFEGVSNDYLFLCDGTNGYTISTTDTFTQVTDAQFPSPHIPNPVYLDGYIFLMTVGADIYNSANDDPTSWTSTDFINAEMYPDRGTALARIGNNILAFGETSVEFFYDAANPTNSPLSPNQAPAIKLGCVAPHAMYQNERFVMFVAQNAVGGKGVWVIEGYTPRKVSTEAIDRMIDAETSITTATGFGIRVMGHLFYVLNLPSSARTLVYDPEQDFWHEWSSNNACAHTVFQCSYATDAAGTILMPDNSSGAVYSFSTTTYQDNAVAILMEVVTAKQDFGNSNRKFYYGVYVVGDTTSASSNLSISWSDDDYTTFNTARTVDMGASRAYLSRLGQSRRRSFKLAYSGNYPMRLEALELDYNLGIM